jgi:hypothetical protein
MNRDQSTGEENNAYSSLNSSIIIVDLVELNELVVHYVVDIEMIFDIH